MELKQRKGLLRNTSDKYYTNSDTVTLCLLALKNEIKIEKNDLIIEPSAGNGSFISGIKSLSINYRFYDLEPENDEIIQHDYLEYNYENDRIMCDALQSKIHVIGNPPFGRQSSLAIKFIRKSCTFCDSLSFILPKSFKKESLQRRFPLNFHLIFQMDLPYKSFLVNGQEHDVPCVFQIWEKKTTLRNDNLKIIPVNFDFVKRDESPDISFRRVGVNAGFIDTTRMIEKSIQSHYFLKFKNGMSVYYNIDKLSCVNFEFNNTVGPKSISKQELIIKIDPLLGDVILFNGL